MEDNVITNPAWWVQTSSLRDMLSGLRQRKEAIKLKYASAEQNNRINSSLNLYENSQSATNKQLQQQYNIASRWDELAWMIVEYGKSKGVEIKWTTKDILNTYLRWNPNRTQAFYDYTHWNQDSEEFAMQMWWIEPQKATWLSIKDILNGNAWTWVDMASTPIKATIDPMLWLAEWTIDAWRRIWNNLWDIKNIAWSDLSFPEKFNKILLGEIIADSVWGSIWDIAGWVIEWLFKWATTQKQRDKMSDAAAWFVQNIMESDLWQDTMNWWNSLSDEEQKEVKDYLTYTDWMINLIWLKWTKAAKPAIEKWVTTISKGIDSWIDAGKKWIKQAIATTEEKIAKRWTNKLAKNKAELLDIADKVWRGETTDVGNTIKTLNDIDTTNVKTFKDLNDAIDTKKRAIVKKIDTYLEKSDWVIDRDALKKIRTTEGKYWPVKYKNNSITTAFDDLSKLYEATNDKKWLAELDQLEKHFYENGFTRKEANDFAREYGNEFKKKAFNKDWSRKVSNVWEGYENTREQIKELVREDLPDDAVKNLDKQYSQLSNTQKLVKNTVEEVNKFNRDLKKKWLMWKVWGMLAKLTEILWQTVTLWTGKWYVQQLAKWLWLLSEDAGKISIDKVEKSLPKLLRRFKELNQKIANAEWKDAEIMLKQAEKDFAKSSKNWGWLSKEIIDNSGITFDLKNNVNLWWKDFTSVSPYPNRTLIVPKKDLTDQTVTEYAKKNMSALMRDWHALGAWVDENGNVYLDVAVALPNKYKPRAIELWKKYNQKAVYDLKNLEEIPSWWDWNVIEVDESVVWDDIKDFLAQ